MESRTSQIEDDKTQHAGVGLAWKRRVLVFWSSSSSMLSVADKMDDGPSAIAHGEATAMTMAPFLALQTAAWERCGPGDCGLGDPTMWDAQSLKQTPGLGCFRSQDARDAQHRFVVPHLPSRVLTPTHPPSLRRRAVCNRPMQR